MDMIANAQSEFRYVGFLDVLGFGNRVLQDYRGTLEAYDILLSTLDIARGVSVGDVSVRIFSDSLLLLSAELRPLLSAANLLQWGALLADCLLRGGIAYGQHLEITREADVYVVSEPLVHASRQEKEVKRPCVALHSTVTPTTQEAGVLSTPNLHRLVLFYDNRWIVNPFTIAWGRSAAHHARCLRDEHPAFASQYTWFLQLYDAVFSPQPFLPSEWPDHG
jgi:hypothetical protein